VATDWHRPPIVDVVTFAPATSRGVERPAADRGLPVPAIETYETRERSFTVERVTRPLYQRLTAGSGSGRG
jgi:hypothetical protein